MKLTARFREVALDIPVEFTKAGEKPVNARMDTDKKRFIDAIPMRDYPSRVQEVRNLARAVEKTALSRAP